MYFLRCVFLVVNGVVQCSSDHHRAAGVAILFLQNVFALEFGSLDRSISVGQTTEITWASDSTDPAVWELAVIDRNADIVATVDSVDGSAGQFSFSFPAVESRYAQNTWPWRHF
jgi:hypothetical protein